MFICRFLNKRCNEIEIFLVYLAVVRDVYKCLEICANVDQTASGERFQDHCSSG